MHLSFTPLDWVVLFTFLALLVFFLNPKLERNRLWTATVTPLASIIGSGYLVSAPLLYFAVKDYAFLAMAGIVILAYLVGEAIRFNILYSEPIIYNPQSGLHKFLFEVERFSNLTLSFAYIISVAFYLRLLSSFIFSGFFHRDWLLENLLTTAILLFIGISGFIRGLDFLEFLEKYAVAIKLSVIFTFLTTLAIYDIQTHYQVRWEYKPITLETLQILAGIFLIVQGFETSKYLGEKYTPAERVKSMKLAQLISGFIYISFIFLVTPLLYLLDKTKLDETAVIMLAAAISVVMGFLIKTGPLMSQFSAAVADTIGSGGLINVETHGKISSRTGYLLVTLIDVVLIWSLNIFEIIAYASKAFAFYYLLQTVIATAVALHKRKWAYFLLFLLLIPVLAFITIFGKSAE